MSDTFDRSQLDGKDREQLSEIASALGVKAISRMRKADLVDAIVTATKSNGGGTATATKPRKIRSTATGRGGDDIESLAAEQDALATADTKSADDDMAMIRPRRRTAATTTTDAPATEAPSSNGDNASGDASHDDGSSNGDAASASSATQTDDRQSGRQSNQQQQSRDQQSWRDDDGQGNRRRRRRRGRDRDGRPSGGGEQREPRLEDYTGELIDIEGLLDLRDEGYGFLRASGYLPGRNDVYVSASQVRRFSLRKGDYVKGATRPPASNEKYPALLRVDLINNQTPDDARSRVRFEDLTPLFPDSKLRLELDDDPAEITGRIIDLISPIGKGQRGMIVSPPKAGKTTIIKQIVYSIERNNPETHVMVLLVDERPEEVTDMRRHVLRAEVIASTFDRPSDEHCHVAELTIERAKRLVEQGQDVVIILDGITRLARAYNLAAPASGRIMSGGIDAGALYPPKKFFGAARNVEEGGSLTILATALVETNSKMDEHIFEEFKGTGNMELRLDRRTADRRIYPAIDVEQSSTRHEELLFDRKDLQQVWKLRRVLSALEGAAGLELLIDKLKSTKSNGEFLNEIAKAPVGMGT
ncbi:MAG TPA: transcription termination factor Rho [Acidimicrobiia bacterium]|nr:transcription termination factor Rho [Acidimicrobiia bacterium]